MSTITVRDDILSFAAAVRDHLDDLPADEADELLDGLEADLSDQAAEAGDAFELPDAAAYAAELRAAAGLPERSENPAATPSLRERLNAADARAARWISTHPVTAATRDFLVALRPVWWILRGFVLYMLVVPLLGIAGPMGVDVLDRALLLVRGNPAPILLLLGMLLLSIQWGRGKWAPVAWARVVRTIVTVIAVLATPFVALGLLSGAQWASQYSTMYPADYDSGYQPGLSIDGERVRNVFAYDADGNPIEQVQLFDQNGRALTTVGRDGATESWDHYFYGGGGPTPVSEQVAGRTPVWNVFPLRELAMTYGGENPEDAVAPAFPFPQVPPLSVLRLDETLQAQSIEPATPVVTPSPGGTTAPTPSESPAP